MLYGIAVVVGLGTALLALWGDDDLWWCELFALMFLALGVLFGWSDRATRLDFERKLVLQGKGHKRADGIPFANLVGILATARTALVRTDQNSYEVRRFALGLLVADDATPLRKSLAAMHRQRVALVRGEGEPATHELSRRLERQMQGHVLEVVDHTDENAVWQASEWLAKKLELPLVDACSSPTVLRIPEELDLSLGERLARGLQGIDATGAYASAPSPDAAAAKSQHDKCTLSWRENRRFDMLMTLGMALLFPVLGLLLFRDDSAGLRICAAFGLCLLPLFLFAAQWHGTNRIVLDRKRVVVTRGPFGKRLPPLAMDSIEAVRVGGTSGYPLLSLVSDRRVLRIRMAAPLAHWAKAHIERHLLAVSKQQLKLADPSE